MKNKMAKALILVLAIAFSFTLFTACSTPGDANNGGTQNYSKGLAYAANEDGKTCTISGIGTCKDTKVVIPETVEGYTVTSIGEFAFSSCIELESVVIPDSVISIGDNAFSACIALESVVIPDSVTSIGEFAFSSCYSLTSVVIGNSVTSIGYAAFSYCTALRSVKIGESVQSISYYAFSNCAFETIVIPDSVTQIYGGAFSVNENLKEISVSPNNPNYCTVDGNLYTKDKKYLVQYLISSTAKSFVIPSTVTRIEAAAFRGCKALESIEIPDTVTYIGAYAFMDCENLKYNIDSNKNKYLGNPSNPYLCFIESSSKTITSTTIDVHCKYIATNAFRNCYSLKSVVIPDSVISIGDYAFSACTALTSIIIPDSVTSIGDYAFMSCHKLMSTVIPDSVTHMGKDVFLGCIYVTVIKCEHESQPSGWDENWNKSNKTVVWGYKA